MAGGKKTTAGADARVDLAPFNPMQPHEQNGSLAVVATLTPPIVVPPITKIIVQAFDQDIRYTIDGADPLPTFGFRLTATNDPIMIPLGPNTILKFVEEAASGVLEFVWGN